MNSYRNAALAIAVAVLSLVATTDSAAAVPKSSIAADIGKCGALPLSQRGICKELALSQSGATLATPTSAVAQQRVAADNARYAHAMAACKRLPISQLNTCVDQAAGTRAEIAQPPSGAQEVARRAEDARYHAALQSCSRLPVSQRYTCASLHGNDEWLSHRG